MVETKEMSDSVVDTGDSDIMMENSKINNGFVETRGISDIFVETRQISDSVPETKQMSDKILETLKISDNLVKTKDVHEMGEEHHPCAGSDDRKNVYVVDNFSENTFTSEIKTSFLESHL